MSCETIIYQPGLVAGEIFNLPEHQNAKSWRTLAEMGWLGLDTCGYVCLELKVRRLREMLEKERKERSESLDARSG